jgi:hypothetical protein
MSRYVLLSLFVIPVSLFNVLSAVVDYKTKALSKKGMLFVSFIWLFVATSVLAAEKVYTYLFSRNLTATEPMSLFDVATISSVIVLASMLLRTRSELTKQSQKHTRIIEAMSKVHLPKNN